jgi:hypothetical protein
LGNQTPDGKGCSGVTAKGTIFFPISSGSLKMKKATRKNHFL